MRNLIVLLLMAFGINVIVSAQPTPVANFLNGEKGYVGSSLNTSLLKGTTTVRSLMKVQLNADFQPKYDCYVKLDSIAGLGKGDVTLYGQLYEKSDTVAITRVKYYGTGKDTTIYFANASAVKYRNFWFGVKGTSGTVGLSYFELKTWR